MMKNQPKQTEAIPCQVLTFNEEEENLIRGYFDKCDYTFDPGGLKEFILDCICEDLENTERKKDSGKKGLADIIMENPELVQKGGELIGNVYKWATSLKKPVR